MFFVASSLEFEPRLVNVAMWAVFDDVSIQHKSQRRRLHLKVQALQEETTKILTMTSETKNQFGTVFWLGLARMFRVEFLNLLMVWSPAYAAK